MLPLRVLYEDKWIVAVSKPSKVPVHSAKFYRGKTLNELVKEQFKTELFSVNRLDSGTSGVFIYGFSSESSGKFQHTLSSDVSIKNYITLVRGSAPIKFEIDIPLKNRTVENILNYHPKIYERSKDHTIDPVKKRSMKLEEMKNLYTLESAKITKEIAQQLTKTETDEGVIFSNPNLPIHEINGVNIFQPAKTQCTKIMDIYGCSLLSVRITTGRYHQIRRHLDKISHQIIGDPTGKSRINSHFKSNFGLERIFLHRDRIETIHPYTNNKLIIHDPLPDDLRNLLLNLPDVSTDIVNKL